ncbi:MAG: hypothetical protein NTU53_16080, partial [Planctomycetota bacterium]|nr:hypothetical protein [Planctomycetota bacterium]
EGARSIFLAMGAGDEVAIGLALAAGTLCVKRQGMGAGEDIRGVLGKGQVQQMVKAMRQALKISNEESDQMQGTLEGIGPLLADERPGAARMKRFLASQTAGLSRRLMGAMKGVGIFVERIEWLVGQLGELEKGDFAPLPLLTGDDLTAAGLRPGPMFKRILERVYDGQLEGRVKDREEAMRMAMEMGSEKGKTRG